MIPGGFSTETRKVAKLAAAATAGTSQIVSAIADTQGFRKAKIITEMLTDAANNNVTLQHGNTVTGGSNVDGIISGATALANNIATSQLDAAANGDLLVYDLQPTQRYLQVTINRGTSTATGTIIVELYDPISLPVTQPANVIVERNSNPTTGSV